MKSNNDSDDNDRIESTEKEEEDDDDDDHGVTTTTTTTVISTNEMMISSTTENKTNEQVDDHSSINNDTNMDIQSTTITQEHCKKRKIQETSLPPTNAATTSNSDGDADQIIDATSDATTTTTTTSIPEETVALPVDTFTVSKSSTVITDAVLQVEEEKETDVIHNTTRETNHGIVVTASNHTIHTNQNTNQNDDTSRTAVTTLISSPIENTTTTTAASTINTIINNTEVEENDRSSSNISTSIPSNDTNDETNHRRGNQSTGSDHNSKPSLSSSSASSSYESLRWMIVTNDGTPNAWIKLIGLKSLFAKQLPKMPRSYIARLVFDVQHTSLVLLSDNPSLHNSDDEIIGSICYRNFPQERFAEIAFCAVNASHQVKGYGTKLMNLLKQIAVQQGIEYFITYADNYAIGYFKKQGFTKQITMPKGRYYGLIKDYDGGTPMECYVHPSIDYYHLPAILHEQRNFLWRRVAHRTALSMTTVYPPLTSEFIYQANHNNNNNNNDTSNTNFESQQQSLTNDIIASSMTNMNNNHIGAGSTGSISMSRSTSSAARALTIPGVMEAGWTLTDLIQATNKSDDMKQKSSVLKQELLGIVRKIDEQQFAWPFREPVTVDEAPDYFDVIRHPIDLKTIANRIRQDNHYKNKQMLYVDLMLMINNCKLYNDDGSTYIQCAVQLEKYIQTVLFHDTITTMSTNMTNYSTTSTTSNMNHLTTTTNAVS